MRRMHNIGEHSISDLAEVFSVSRPTVFRTLQSQPGNIYERCIGSPENRGTWQ
ncbi:MAG: helix-turn-helix domain-containing protein [Pseudomonadota bacterium]